MKKTFAIVLSLCLLAMTLAACGGAPPASEGEDPAVSASSPAAETGSGEASGGDITLRVGCQYQMDNVMSIYNTAKEKFEAENPGVTVEYVQQERDLYHTMGLPTMLNGKNSPDVYFEWSGQRLLDRKAEGFLQPIKELSDSEWGDQFLDSAFSGSTIDGERYLVPEASDVSNVIWYNKAIFTELGVEVPTTWDEMITACETIQGAGYVPFAMGNKGFWPMGNWGAHILSRVVGEDVYNDAMTFQSDFNTPEWAAAMDYIAQLGPYMNPDLSALNDEEAGVLFYTGEAAMYPMGNWAISAIKENAPEGFEYDYFNQPAMPEGSKGDQTSAIAVTTGFVVNAKTQYYDEAVAFLKVFSSHDQEVALAEVAYMPPAKGVVTEENADPLMVRLMNETLGGTETTISPPDTGYELEAGNNLYNAIAKVLSGEVSSADALKELDEANAHLK